MVLEVVPVRRPLLKFGLSSEQFSTSQRELHERPALVQHQPALGDRQIKACLVFGRRSLELKQEGPVDLLDMDTAVLDRLNGVGQFDDLARSGLRSA